MSSFFKENLFSGLDYNHKSDNNLNEYRYYQCSLKLNKLKCTKIFIPTCNNKDLVSINTLIPEKLDNIILKYKYFPKKVIIEK